MDIPGNYIDGLDISIKKTSILIEWFRQNNNTVMPIFSLLQLKIIIVVTI